MLKIYKYLKEVGNEIDYGTHGDVTETSQVDNSKKAWIDKIEKEWKICRNSSLSKILMILSKRSHDREAETDGIPKKLGHLYDYNLCYPRFFKSPRF